MVQKMYKGPSGQMFNAKQLSEGAALVRKSGGDGAFPAWADKERGLNRQGRTQLGPPAKVSAGKKKMTPRYA
jgi:hypothetical protein